ncbi:sensor histidine kinase [Dyadobacter psychrotolerans]|nr:histidine kinase [Dyadobacter psychrotolerans]
MSRESDVYAQFKLLQSGSLWLFFLIYFAIFYLNIFVLIPGLFLKQQYILYSIIFVAGLSLIFYTQPFEKLIFQKFHESEQIGRTGREERFRLPPPEMRMDTDRPPPGEIRPENPLRVDFVSLVLFVVVWVVGMATKISEQWRLSEKKVILSEADKAQAELSFFKAQINPHFLFNTLNNIYSLAITKSDHTAPSILKLSKMMRYITEEATQDFVPLHDEITCLESYIDLQKLRLNDKTRVNFKIDGEIKNKQIAPLILMTFVENAFKYGVSNRFENEIDIRLESTATSVYFFCRNEIFEANEAGERQGIGIANTRKRLDFLYPDRYDLKISKEEKTFEVSLTVH